MSQTLQILKTQLNKSRNLCYYGKYQQSLLQFQKIQSKIQTQIYQLNNTSLNFDKLLIDQWNKLYQEIKYEKELVGVTYDMLQGNIDGKVPGRGDVYSNNGNNNSNNNNINNNGAFKKTPSSISTNSNNSTKEIFSSKQDNVTNDNRKPKLPFGKQPFKKRVHEDDEIYNRKQRQQRRRQQEQEQRREKQQRRQQRRQRQRSYEKQQKKQKSNQSEVWDEIFPKNKPQQKPLAKKTSYNNNTNNTNYNYIDKKVQKNQSAVDKNQQRQYQKPWMKNAKKQGKKQQKQQKKTFLKHCYPDGNGPDANLIEALQRQVVDLSPNISFDDIAELTKAKEILEEAVLLPLALPHLFTGNRRAWKGVMLFGPPGTGKTLLAKAVASSGATTFFNVTASSLASKWRGQSQKMVRLLFEMAKFYAPATIFIDQIDSLASARGQKQDQSSRRVKTQLMTRIDGCTTGSQDNKLITVIGATNRPWDLDQAIRRRLQKRIYIPLPTEIGRKQLLRINLKNQKTQTLDIEQIIRRTQGYSGADIANLCRQAAYMPMRRKLKAEGGLGKKLNDLNWKEKFQKEVNIPLTMDDFNEALKNVKPSVGQGDLKNYMDWMAEFGEQGTTI